MIGREGKKARKELSPPERRRSAGDSKFSLAGKAVLMDPWKALRIHIFAPHMLFPCIKK